MSKRRFWQIHLSTAISLLLLVSAIMWLNFMHWHASEFASSAGWPLPFYDEPDYNYINPAWIALNFAAWVTLVAGFAAFLERISRGREPRR